MSHRVDGYLPPQTAAATDGYPTTMYAQDSTGTGSFGGRIILKAGVGSADGYDGYVYIQSGTHIDLVIDGYNAAFFPSGVTGSFGSGKSVIFIANATVTPSANPTGGGILYVEGGALKYRGPSGSITTIAPA